MQKPLRILYVGNNRLPSEKADSLYVMKLCEAFAGQGVDVSLLAPRRVNQIARDPFAYYGVRRIFAIQKVFSLDFLFLSRAPFLFMKFFFLAQAVTFGFFAARFVRKWSAGKNGGAVIVHEPYTLFFLSFMRWTQNPIAYDLHIGAKKNFFWWRVLSVPTRFFVLTSFIRENIRSFGVSAPIAVSPDAVDLEVFGRPCEKKHARETLNLPADSFLCVYAGHLYAWKGIGTILDAAKLLPQDVLLYLVGGTDADISNLKFQILNLKITNITIVGRKPYAEIPLWLCAADVLLLPNSAREAISREYTSPMKMFEYMASNRPIVASRLPSLTEILNDENAELVEADNPGAFAEGILRLKNDSERWRRIAEQARKNVVSYTWDAKSKAMLSAIFPL